MKINLVLFIVIVSLMIPAVSQATPPKPGSYVSGFLGGTLLKTADVTTEDFVANTTYNDRVKFHPGSNIGMTGGYDFGYFRMEGELSYKNSSIRSVVDQSDNYRFRNVDGDLGAFAMMFNSFLDLHNDSRVTPYFGGGIGFATLYLSDTYGTNTRGGITTRDLLYREDNTSVLAWQIGGGLEITLNQMLSLDVGYRYFGTSRGTFENSWDQSTELRFQGHNVAAGLRFRF